MGFKTLVIHILLFSLSNQSKDGFRVEFSRLGKKHSVVSLLDLPATRGKSLIDHGGFIRLDVNQVQKSLQSTTVWLVIFKTFCSKQHMRKIVAYVTMRTSQRNITKKSSRK